MKHRMSREKIEGIIREYTDGQTEANIARHFRVSPTTISNVLKHTEVYKCSECGVLPIINGVIVHDEDKDHEGIELT